MTQIHIQPGNPLSGACTVPGDQLISHWAAILAAIAEGTSHLRGFGASEESRVTLDVLRALGVTIEDISPTELIIHGRGLDGLQEPNDVLYCGNSPTTLCLLSGLLVGQRFASFLSGNEQVRREPRGQIVRPLRGMGADIMGRQGGELAPFGIRPVRLRSIEYQLPVDGGSIKSVLLLAGMYAQGLTILKERTPSPDHCERLLRAMDAPIEIYGATLHIDRPRSPLKPVTFAVPGNPSLAAFLLVAGAIIPGSRIQINSVSINPTRIILFRLLAEMGAVIRYHNQRMEGGEPVADVEVLHSELKGGLLDGDLIATMQDELPIFVLAASQAKGTTTVRGATGRNTSINDKLVAMVGELRKMGVKIEPLDDGFVVEGKTLLRGAPVESHGDPYLAMTLTIAGLLAMGATTVHASQVIADSFPRFEVLLQALGGKLWVEE